MDDVLALSDSQAARRERVIQAATKLGARGGYDAVQMREVANEAGVALGTIYRYFSSKDHLLAATLVAWVEDLEHRISQRPPTGVTASDRVAQVLRRASRAMEREPRLAEAVVTAMVSPDPATALPQHQMTEAMTRVLARAMGEDGLDPDFVVDVTGVLSHVWFSSLIGWVNGRWEIHKVGTEVELAARLLLDKR